MLIQKIIRERLGWFSQNNHQKIMLYKGCFAVYIQFSYMILNFILRSRQIATKSTPAKLNYLVKIDNNEEGISGKVIPILVGIRIYLTYMRQVGAVFLADHKGSIRTTNTRSVAGKKIGTEAPILKLFH